MDFLTHNLAPIMFGALFLFLLIGYPIAFSLAALGLFFGILGIELGLLKPELYQSLPSRVFGIMGNDNLLAIPFFTLMGFIFDRSGLAEELLETIGQLFGSVRGGIAYAVIFVGAILGGPAGVVAATVISMGLISLPVMLRYGYDRRLASGVISASGTLAQIIPPSIVLVVVAEQMKVSVGDAYLGALGPSLVLVGLYFLYVFGVTLVKPDHAPALPLEARMVKVPERFTAPFIEHLPAIVLCSGIVWLVKNEQIGKQLAFGGTLALVAAFVFILAQLRKEKLSAIVQQHASAIFFLITLVGLEISTLGPSELVAWQWQLLESAGLSPATWTVILIAIISLLLVRLQMSLGRIGHNRIVTAMMPQILLIFLTLGTIATGLATPTEGGAMGAFGTLMLALIRRKLNWKLLTQAVVETTKLTSFVMFVLIGATFFSLTFYGLEGNTWVEELLTSLPGGKIGFLIVVNLIVFGLAFFLDVFELAFIIIPLLRPVVEKMGIDPVWFTVMLGVNMQTAFMHPPFGFALMYLRSVAPEKPYIDKITAKIIAPITTAQIYLGAIPFVIVQLIMVALLIAFPGIVGEQQRKKVEDKPLNIEVPTEAPAEAPPLQFNLEPDEKK